MSQESLRMTSHFIYFSQEEKDELFRAYLCRHIIYQTNQHSNSFLSLLGFTHRVQRALDYKRSPAMFILYHFLPQVQLFFSRQVRVNLYLLGLIAPHSFLQSNIHLLFLYPFSLSDFLQLFFELFGNIGSRDDLCLFFDEVGNERGVFFQERFLEKYGFAAEDESDCPFLFGLEDWVFDDDTVPFFEFLSKIGIVAVYGSSAGGDGALPWFRFEIDNLVWLENFLLLLLFNFFLLTSLFRDICRLRQPFFEFQLSKLKVIHHPNSNYLMKYYKTIIYQLNLLKFYLVKVISLISFHCFFAIFPCKLKDFGLQLIKQSKKKRKERNRKTRQKQLKYRYSDI